MKINLKSESEIISSTYFDTGVKPWDADILRCEELKNLPELRVNQDNFDGVMKVCKRYTWKTKLRKCKGQFFVLPGDEKLLGHRTKGSAAIQTLGHKS